jgi:hypothetical protein
MKIFYHNVCDCTATHLFNMLLLMKLLMNVMPLTVSSSVSFLLQYEYGIQLLRPEQQLVQKCCAVIDLQKNMQLIVWSFNVEYNNMITHFMDHYIYGCQTWHDGM